MKQLHHTIINNQQVSTTTPMTSKQFCQSQHWNSHISVTSNRLVPKIKSIKWHLCPYLVQLTYIAVHVSVIMNVNTIDWCNHFFLPSFSITSPLLPMFKLNYCMFEVTHSWHNSLQTFGKTLGFGFFGMPVGCTVPLGRVIFSTIQYTCMNDYYSFCFYDAAALIALSILQQKLSAKR